MGKKLIYLLKGLLFSSFLMGALVLLLAFLMYKAGLSEQVMSVLLFVGFFLSAYIGGAYFAKHAEKRRFLWGLLFGTVFFAVYLFIVFCYGTFGELTVSRAALMAGLLLGGGMMGGMFSGGK